MMKIKILVVDDDKDVLGFFKDYFNTFGHDIITTNDPYKALEIIKDQNIDIVILDIQMPDMDGISVLREIKQINSLIQVVMMTAHSSFLKTVESIRYGADDYLKKPFNFEEVEEILHYIIKKTKRLYAAINS